MTKIVLADDHQVVRKSIKTLLNTESDFEIVGEAEDGLQAIDMVVRLKPDILVLDLMMPGINGLEVTRQLNEKNYPTRIVILSMHGDGPYVIEALRSGAQGYILKEASSEELVKGIREIIAGHPYLSSCLSLCAVDAYYGRQSLAAS